jgi:hypothetical protein
MPGHRATRIPAGQRPSRQKPLPQGPGEKRWKSRAGGWPLSGQRRPVGGAAVVQRASVSSSREIVAVVLNIQCCQSRK